MTVQFYEGLQGQPLDGLIDPVDLPNTIRLIARPNQKTMHPLLVDVLRSLGITRAIPSKGRGAGTPATLSAAWALAHRVERIYIGEAQDLTAVALDECLDFADRLGADLHLIYGYGQTYTHASHLERRGAAFQPYEALPELIQRPIRLLGDHSNPTPDPGPVPEDEWVTFRAAYRALWTTTESEACDLLYRETMHAVGASGPTTPDALAQLIGSLWQEHACEGHRRLVVIRAAQAAMFLAGWNAKMKERWLERHILDRYTNPLHAHHFQHMATVADPWRASAALLHARHIRISDMLALRARDVGPTGGIDGLALRPGERLILSAQRWAQLISSDDPEPPLFSRPETSVRSGIRALAAELSLPLLTEWRRGDDKKFDLRIGITLEHIGASA